jgi:hypothetical protein
MKALFWYDAFLIASPFLFAAVKPKLLHARLVQWSETENLKFAYLSEA